MTTEERLEKPERELARGKHNNRRLMIGAAVCLGMIFAWTFFGQSARLGTAQAAGRAAQDQAAQEQASRDTYARARANSTAAQTALLNAIMQGSGGGSQQMAGQLLLQEQAFAHEEKLQQQEFAHEKERMGFQQRQAP